MESMVSFVKGFCLAKVIRIVIGGQFAQVSGRQEKRQGPNFLSLFLRKTCLWKSAQLVIIMSSKKVAIKIAVNRQSKKKERKKKTEKFD